MSLSIDIVGTAVVGNCLSNWRRDEAVVEEDDDSSEPVPPDLDIDSIISEASASAESAGNTGANAAWLYTVETYSNTQKKRKKQGNCYYVYKQVYKHVMYLVLYLIYFDHLFHNQKVLGSLAFVYHHPLKTTNKTSSQKNKTSLQTVHKHDY